MAKAIHKVMRNEKWELTPTGECGKRWTVGSVIWKHVTCVNCLKVWKKQRSGTEQAVMDKRTVWLVLREYADQKDLVVGVYDSQEQAMDVFRVVDSYCTNDSFVVMAVLVQSASTGEIHADE